MRLIILALTLIFTLPTYAEELNPTEDVVVEENILLPVILKKTKDDNVEAGLTELKTDAIESGLHKLILDGSKVTTKGEDGAKEVKITWTGAYIIKDDGEKKSTYIGEPFNSELIATPDLEKGDTFSVEGKASELLAAWQRLMAKEEKEETKEEPTPQEEVAQPSQNFGGNAQEQARPLSFTPPDFVNEPDPVITSTTDGCSINVDIAQMAAIVQERVLQDGQEIAPCDDTLTRYPLEKKYSTCPLFVDITNLQVQEQYTLRYTDPTSGGSIQVQDCAPDDEKSIPITEDFAACSIRHDFTLGQSFKQSRLIYTDKDGLIQEIQPCTDTTTAYAHIITEETCSPVIDTAGSTVTFQNRKKISVDGSEQFITDCTPDSSSTVTIEEEVCASPRYSHDFATSQSYLNKNYFYTKDITRVDVLNCVQSEITFPHKQDETQCAAQNDDVNKETTLYAKTYIEEVIGTPVYISSCQGVTPTVPYIRLGGKWRVISSGLANITLDDSAYTDRLANLTSDPVTGSTLPNRGTCDGSNDQIYYWNIYTSGTTYCIYGTMTAPWTSGSVTINSAESDAQPTHLGRTVTATYSNPTGGYCPIQRTGTDISCISAQCTLTQLQKNPIYLRGDSSEYTDFTTNEGTEYVCGTGSKLDGKIE